MGNYDWGLTPVLLMVAKETVTPVRQLYGWPVTEFLYYASHIVECEKRKIRELKKITKK